jgi:RNA polymerase sigma-70 factor, ECF subfamily
MVAFRPESCTLHSGSHMPLAARSNSLLQRVASGDKAAAREMLDRFGPLVWSLARSFAHSQADAEDATQDVFIHLWKKAHMYDERFGDEEQFVAVVARRRLIDRYRTNKSRPLAFVADDTQIAQSIATATSDHPHDARIAQDHLASLVEEERVVLVLSIVRGLTHDQIARHLAMPLGTVKTHMYRGLASLRDRLLRDDTRTLSHHERRTTR